MVKHHLRPWIVVVLVTCTLGYVLAPDVGKVRYGAYLMRSYKNHCRIAKGLRAYAKAHGQLPPPFLPDNGGVPAHSWRVLILPYIGHESLYAKYRFDEPWNGPHNSELLAEIPDVYKCDDGPDAERTGLTSFLAVTGPTTVWAKGDPSSPISAVDRPWTVLLLQFIRHQVPWTSPQDLALQEMFGPDDELQVVPSSSDDDKAFFVTFLDGETRLIEDISPRLLKALISVDQEAQVEDVDSIRFR